MNKSLDLLQNFLILYCIINYTVTSTCSTNFKGETLTLLTKTVRLIFQFKIYINEDSLSAFCS